MSLSQLRIIRPIAPGKTEMRTCIAPKGESAGGARMRIRNYEDFSCNPTGMATPDYHHLR